MRRVTAVTYGQPGPFQRVMAVSMRSLRDLGRDASCCALCGMQLRQGRQARAFSRDYLAGLIPFQSEQLLRINPDGMNLCILFQPCEECGHRNVIGESWPL